MADTRPAGLAEAVTARGRRGRPTKERAASLGRLIQKAALELFLNLGFEAVTMDAIAGHIGISKGTLYGRYSSKADLLRAIFEGEIEEWGRRASETVGPIPDDLRERLQLRARTIIFSQGWVEIRRMERLIAEISGNFPDLAAAYFEVGQRKFLRYLADDIRHFVPDRDDGRPSANVFAAILLHTITGWHRGESVHREVPDEEALRFADAVIAAIMTNLEQPDTARPGSAR